jgi:methylmalonyl-CoA mutase N-terminal domain/subunit
MFLKKAIDRITRSKIEYDRKVFGRLKDQGIHSVEGKTISGLPLKHFYTPLDVKETDYLKDINFPGEYPFSTGIHPTGYLTKEWTRRQVIGIGTAEETNERLKYLLRQGQTGFSVCGMGYKSYDSDDERSHGHLGKGGVWIDTLADIEALFDGIDMEKITINQIGYSIPIFAMILALAEKRGVEISRLQGTIQNTVFPGGDGPERRGNGSIDIVEFCARNMPRWNHTSISVRNMRDQGISAPQEIGFGLYCGYYTIQSAMARGLHVDDIAPRVSFFLSAENDFLEEVAKFRAMRRMWARLMKERLGAKSPRSWTLRYHVQTSAVNLTAQQPLNNIIRSTLHALAAVMGGAQSMSVNSFDEALAIPTEASATLSLRTQQIIAYESNVTGVIDPFAGSYCVESLTNQVEKSAWEIYEKLLGMDDQEALKWMDREIEEAAYKRQIAIDRGERVVVGVNRFVMDEEEEASHFSANTVPYDPSWRDKQIRRLYEVRERRDAKKADEAKKKLARAYDQKINIIPTMIDAVKAYLSIGEIARIRKDVTGETPSLDLYFGK